MKNMAPRKKVPFFQVPPFYYIPLIIVGMTLTTVSCVGAYYSGSYERVPSFLLLKVLTASPDLLPYSSLGYIGAFLHYIAYEQPTLMAFM